MLYGRISAPECRVSFFPVLGTQPPFTVGGSARLNRTNTNDADSLIAVTTHKDLGQPCGQFSVSMVHQGFNGDSWRDLLRVGDMVLIELGPDAPQPDLEFTPANGWPPGLEPVMVGTLDDIHERFVMGPDGKPQRAVTVTGRDLAKYLVDDQIWWDAWSDVERATAGFSPEINDWLRSGQDGARASGLVGFLFKWLTDHFDIAYTLGLGGGKSREYRLFSEIIRPVLYDLTPALAGPWSWESYQGGPWSMMQRAAAAPFTVFVYDLRREWDLNWLQAISGGFLANVGPRNPLRWNTPNGAFNSIASLMLYRTPWSNRDYDDWTSLPTRVVREADLIAAELGRSGAEISNTWRIRADVQGPIRPQESGEWHDALDTRDFVSIQRFGERPLLITSPFINGNPGADLLPILRQFTFRLKDWNRWNEHFLSGRLTFKGMASIRVGDRLWYWDHECGSSTPGGFEGGVDFYVEAVTQEFQAFGHWTTTVEVTRGQLHRNQGQTLQFTDIPTGRPRPRPQPPGFDATQGVAAQQALEELANQVRVGPGRRFQQLHSVMPPPRRTG